jgi:hypothetical protein
MPAEPSFPYPLGVTIVDGGVNVALYSSIADGVTFSTFDAGGSESSHPLTLADSDIWRTTTSPDAATRSAPPARPSDD